METWLWVQKQGVLFARSIKQVDVEGRPLALAWSLPRSVVRVCVRGCVCAHVRACMRVHTHLHMCVHMR